MSLDRLFEYHGEKNIYIHITFKLSMFGNKIYCSSSLKHNRIMLKFKLISTDNINQCFVWQCNEVLPSCTNRTITLCKIVDLYNIYLLYRYIYFSLGNSAICTRKYCIYIIFLYLFTNARL